ncbi:hypothetical protein HUU42_12425 [bacterium]|nr:hypothetical protein [bacterium]
MGFDIMWKGGITQNVTFTNTNIENTQQKSRQTSNSKSITSTLSYVKRGGFRLPLWFLKNKQLNNEVRISNTFAYNKRVSFNYNTTLEIPEKKKTDEATIWSVEPRIDYSFTSRLTGGMFFKYESNKSLIAGKITRILAGINVNISIGT